MDQQSFSIFYSWQSDLSKDTNLNGIRSSLRNASNKVEQELSDVQIKLDEATRDKSGSIDITNTLLDKIENCDIFVCDLTTINGDTSDKRKVPNPNVLVELGFAIASIGWERILILFNTVYGNFKDDLPFDIDRRRITKFAITDRKDKSSKEQLTDVLKEGIKKVIEDAPLKPHQKREVNPERIKRESDLKILKLVMVRIHIRTLDHFIDELPDRIYINATYFYEDLASLIESSIFFIYDDELRRKLNLLKTTWARCLSFSHHYSANKSDKYVNFHMQLDLIIDDKAREDYIKIKKLRNSLKRNLKDFLTYVRMHYLEIDVTKTSQKALDNYNEFMDIL